MAETKIIKQKKELGKLIAPFENKWVALSPDYKKVIASGTTLRAVYKKIASEKMSRQPVMMKVVGLSMDYSPTVYAV